MKRTFKLLIACIAILMMACLVVACDFGGDSCDHDFVEIHREEACVGYGMVYYECSKCGYPSNDRLDAVGHDIEVIAAVEPTCTVNGSTAGEKCKRCGEYVIEPKEIPAQHTIATRDAVEATCTENGKTEEQYCTVCNTVTVPSTTIYAAHNFEKIVAIEPTCTEDGWSEGEACSRCGLTLKEPEKIPAGHVLEHVEAISKTCTEDGRTEGEQCVNCGHVESGLEVVPAGHDPAISNPGYPATCKEPGLSDETYCMTCGETLTYQEEIPIIDHTREIIKGYVATCSSTGLTNGYRCSSCGDVLVEQEVIPVTPHTAVTVKGYTSTCTSVGLSDGEKCKDCGMIMKNQYTITSDGHNYVDGQCTECNLKVTTGLIFEELVSTFSFVRSTTQYVVAGLEDGENPTTLVIPDTHDGCPVVGIKAGAFENKASIQKVVIPKTIEAIGDNAFSGCYNLETIECADFAQPEAWGSSWYGSDTPTFKITAIFNQGKTPYETYVEAMNNIAHNYENYTFTSKYSTYLMGEKMLSTTTTQQVSGRDFLMISTEIDYASGGDVSRTIKGYVDGHLYFEQYGNLYAEPRSYEYWLHKETISSASIEMQPEDFKDVEFYKDVDGKMYVKMKFSANRLVEIMELMYPDMSFEGIQLSDPVYDYTFSADGYIESYGFSATMNGAFIIEGISTFSDIGSTYVDRSYLYGASYLSVTSCSGDHTPVEVEQIDSTCFAQGRSAYSYCEKCYVALSYMTPIDPAHNFENGECTECGSFEDVNTSKGLAYALNEDQTGYILVGMGACEDIDVYIPAYIYGRPIVAILSDAFTGTNVEYVIINGESIHISEFNGWTK